MTHDEYLERHEEFQNTGSHRFIILEVVRDRLAAFEILEEREKCFRVKMASSSLIYRGDKTFWLPKFFIANKRFSNPDYLGVLKINTHFLHMIDFQMRVNLNMIH